MKTKLLLLSTILFSICNVNAATYLFKIQDTNVANAIIVDKEEPITPERVFIPVDNDNPLVSLGYYNDMSCGYSFDTYRLTVNIEGSVDMNGKPNPYSLKFNSNFYETYSVDENGNLFLYIDQNLDETYQDNEEKYYFGELVGSEFGYKNYQVCK